MQQNFHLITRFAKKHIRKKKNTMHAELSCFWFRLTQHRRPFPVSLLFFTTPVQTSRIPIADSQPSSTSHCDHIVASYEEAFRRGALLVTSLLSVSLFRFFKSTHAFLPFPCLRVSLSRSLRKSAPTLLQLSRKLRRCAGSSVKRTQRGKRASLSPCVTSKSPAQLPLHYIYLH